MPRLGIPEAVRKHKANHTGKPSPGKYPRKPVGKSLCLAYIHPGGGRVIISASRRTDIPAFYGDWFINRLREKRVLVRNPVNQAMVSEIPLKPDLVECIVFWTKNPRAFMPCLDQIDGLGFRYYFQFTLTPYDNSIEKNIEKGAVIETFIALSERLGKERVIWRYDPIFINEQHSAAYHLEKYDELCGKLCRYTDTCVISFIDTYGFLKKTFTARDIQTVPEETMVALLKGITARAKSGGIRVCSCCEGISLAEYGIGHNKCVDDELIEKLFGVKTAYKKDPSQRPACGCTQSRDIGAYNTCRHGCIYCYARRGKPKEACDPASPLLGEP
jgi:hypothetical protein